MDAFSLWGLCLSFSSTEGGYTNRALSGHIFFKSLGDVLVVAHAGVLHLNKCITKPTNKKKMFQYSDILHYIIRDILNGLCVVAINYRSTSMPFSYSNYSSTSGQDIEEDMPLMQWRAKRRRGWKKRSGWISGHRQRLMWDEPHCRQQKYAVCLGLKEKNTIVRGTHI